MALTPVRKSVDDYPIAPESLTLVNMLERLLERVVGLFEQQGVPLPTRRYWMMGPEIPEDCAQVVVSFIQTYLGAPGDQAADAQKCNAPRTGVFNIAITRDYPLAEMGKAVSEERIIAASKWAAVDSAVLMWGLEELNTLEDGFPGPGVIATVNVPPPNGAVQTTIMNLSMMIS